jgi:hypothetical protein
MRDSSSMGGEEYEAVAGVYAGIERIRFKWYRDIKKMNANYRVYVGETTSTH